MGLFDYLRQRIEEKKQKVQFARMMNGQTPIFSQFGNNIYASDVVQQAVSCIVQEISKLNPTHVKLIDGVDSIPQDSDIQNVLDAPNEIMSTSDMLEKITWNLFLNYNSFILPTWNGGRLTGLYPLQPANVDFFEDVSGKLLVKFHFNNGYDSGMIKYSDVIHIRKNFSVNDYMGGNSQGQPDNGALLKTLELNDILLQGVGKALKSSFAVNGIVKYNTLVDDGETEAALRTLEAKLKNSENGFLPLDLKTEFIPFQKQIEMVDADTLKFIDEKILRQFGVPLCILTGDYTKEQYEAFYQKTLEPIIIKLGQCFTKGIFSTRANLGYGNKIVFYEKELIFMTMTQKLELARILGDRGAIYENEIRVMFGLQPLPELNGKRKQSLNYVDVEIANDYQLGNDSGGVDNGEN
jgi:HK97 family phage portal protein|nr:MAG TPA: portal protein [Caudoviricetes sp.]